MCARYLGFVLLIWFAGVTHAQTVKFCTLPELIGGYIFPEQQTYSPGSVFTYACDSGLKPVAEGWWATSRCENGKWVDEPQCINENACLPPPPIPHGEYRKNHWYETQSPIKVTCEAGYVLKGNSKPRCINGTWTSLPVCERSNNSCSEPPKISHAVIIHRYQEVFSADSKVQYECEEGYTQKRNSTVVCKDGQWTVGPTCNKSSADQGNAAPDRDIQPEGTERRESGTGSVGGMGRGQHDPAVSGRQPSGGGRGTTGHQGGSSTTSDSNDRDNSPMLMNIRSCGARPIIEHAEVVDEAPMYLKYQCNNFYKLAGPGTVNCYSDHSWSKLPTCEEAFCEVDPARYARYGLAAGLSEYMHEGEKKYFPCTTRDQYIYVWCTNRRIALTTCCDGYGYRYSQSCSRFSEPN